MSISTKTGDDGTCGMMFNRRVSKTDPHVEAYGAVDELTSALGVSRATAGPGPLNEEIHRIQKELFVMMSELALLDEDRTRYERQFKGQYLAADATSRLTTLVHEGEARVEFKDWVIPGGTPLGAALDLTRAVCRRAERRVVALREGTPTLNPEILRYLNRLSDLCCIWARQAEAGQGISPDSIENRKSKIKNPPPAP